MFTTDVSLQNMNDILEKSNSMTYLSAMLWKEAFANEF